MITVKGIEQIILMLVDSDPELKSARPYGEFRVNNKRTDDYPVLFYEFAQGDMTQPQPGKWNREITMAIGVAIQLLEGRINEIDMKSRAVSILEKTILKLRASSEFAAVGVRFPDKSVTISNLDETGDDLITGVFTNIKFVLPVVVCEDDLPYLPIGTQSNTYEPSDPSSLFCSLLNDCPTIEEMQDDIAILFTLTGGTGGAATYVQPGLNIYTGGTESSPIVGLKGSIALTAVTANNPGSIAINGASTSSTAGYFASVNYLAIHAQSQNYTAGYFTSASSGDPVMHIFGQGSGITLRVSDGLSASALATFEGQTGQLTIEANGALSWTQQAAVDTTVFNLGLSGLKPVAPGLNTYTADTIGNTIVGMVGSPSFTSVTASNFISGSTNLNQIFAPIGAIGASTYVQPGLNVFTAGTASSPVVGVVGSPSFTAVTASNFISGATNLSSLFAPASVVATYVQPGLNISTGGTITRPIINTLGTVVFTSVTTSNLLAQGINTFTNSTNVVNNTSFSSSDSQPTMFTNGVYLWDRSTLLLNNKATFSCDTSDGTTRFVVNRLGEFGASILATGNIRATANISGATFYSGATELGSLFASSAPTYVQPGLNITTGGTITRPIVNLAGSIVLTAVTASATVQARDIVATLSLSGQNVTATTLVSTTATITTLNNTTLNGATINGTTGAITTITSTTASASGNLSGGTVFEGSTSLVNKYAPKDLTVTLNSGTYILALTDDSRLVDLSGASAQNCVVPRNSAVALPIGAQVMVFQSGAGQVSFSADTGVTIRSYSSQIKIAGQYGGASLVKKGTDEWALFGNLSA